MFVLQFVMSDWHKWELIEKRNVKEMVYDTLKLKDTSSVNAENIKRGMAADFLINVCAMNDPILNEKLT